MTQEERDQILLDLKEHNKIIDSKLAEHDEHFKSIDSKLAEHDEHFKSIDSILAEHSRELNSLSRSIAVIEYDHGNKIQAILDVTSVILNKLDSLEKNFESNNKILENHDNRIWKLESKIGFI